MELSYTNVVRIEIRKGKYQLQNWQKMFLYSG